MTSCCVPSVPLPGCRLQEAAGGGCLLVVGGTCAAQGVCISKTQPQIIPTPQRLRKTNCDDTVP